MKLLVLLSICFLNLSLFSQNNIHHLNKELTTANDVKKHYSNPNLYLIQNPTFDKIVINQTYKSVKNRYKLKNIIGTLDSIVDFSDNYFMKKREYKYDNYGNLILEKTYSRSSDSALWHPSTYYIYAYDSNQNTSSKTFLEWDYSNTKWIKISKAELLYNNIQERISQLNYQWDGSIATWYLTTRIVYSYTSNSIIDTIYYDKYSKSQWENISKDVYLYDSLDKTKEYLFSKYVNNSWDTRFKIDYYYDSIGNPSKTIVFDYNTTNNQLDSTYKFYFTFDTLNQLCIYDVYKWDTTYFNNWRFYKRYMYTYDSQGKIIDRIQYLNHSTYGLIAMERMISTYDPSGNELTTCELNKNGTALTLDTVYVDSCSYNYNFNNDDLALPLNVSNPNMITGWKSDFWSFDFQSQINTRNKDRLTVCYYSNTVGFNKTEYLNTCLSQPHKRIHYI